MLDAIKNLIPYQFKMDPNGPYNKLRKILGVARYRYNRLEKSVDDNPEISNLFPAERVQKHYVYEPMRQSVEFPALYVNQIRYYRIYKYFQAHHPDMFDEKTRIIDVGDTSGMLFQAMGKDGLSANINQDVVNFIKRNGIRADVQNAENLTYGDKSFDYGFCFQCLEHTKNPLRVLDELGRVVNKKVFLSIPYVEKTRIISKDLTVRVKKMPMNCGGYGESEVRDADCHIFEFSTSDMIKVLDFTLLEYVDNFPIDYYAPLGLIRINRGSFFNFFILKPRGIIETGNR